MSSVKPIFIVGCPRSGTTLLRTMLNVHSEISIPPESDFLVKLFPRWRKKKIDKESLVEELLDDLYSNDKFPQWGLEREYLKKKLVRKIPFDYSRFVDEVYSSFLTGKVWGDKNPQYIYETGKIGKLFPGARFIHIIRDGRAVFASHLKANKLKRGQGMLKKFPNDPYLSFLSWKRALEKGEKLRGKDNYLEIRYEELVFSPKETLAKVCRFLGLDFEAGMIRYYRKGAEAVPEERRSIHKNISKRIDATRTDAWKRELSPREILKYELVGQGKLKEYGYPVNFTFSHVFSVDWRIFYFLLKMFFYKLPQSFQSKIEKVFVRK